MNSAMPAKWHASPPEWPSIPPSGHTQSQHRRALALRSNSLCGPTPSLIRPTPPRQLKTSGQRSWCRASGVPGFLCDPGVFARGLCVSRQGAKEEQSVRAGAPNRLSRSGRLMRLRIPGGCGASGVPGFLCELRVFERGLSVSHQGAKTQRKSSQYGK